MCRGLTRRLDSVTMLPLFVLSMIHKITAARGYVYGRTATHWRWYSGEVAMKPCIKCGQTKPIKMFYKHPEMGDGHLNKCIECCKDDANEHRAANLEKVREYERIRGRTPRRKEKVRNYKRTARLKHPERFREYQKTARLKHPEKYKANQAVGNAIRSGRLVRGQCEVCGTTEHVHGHHNDYSKPLDVRWLCREHHWDVHRKMTA